VPVCEPACGVLRAVQAIPRKHGGEFVKVVVGVPAGDRVHTEFVVCLGDMLLYTAKALPDLELELRMQMSSLVAFNRNELAKYALEQKADYLLFIDSDMEFPPYALNRILDEALGGEYEILGYNYTQRGPPFQGLALDLAGKQVEHGKWVIEVSRLPTGFMLINLGVFAKLKSPYFHHPIEDGHIVSEDYAFCDDARKAGIRLWMDADMSREIRHIGTAYTRWVSGLGCQNEF
jgi:hypothetical protein